MDTGPKIRNSTVKFILNKQEKTQLIIHRYETIDDLFTNWSFLHGLPTSSVAPSGNDLKDK